MSTLKADTIQSTSGGAATLTNQQAAKAWFNKASNGASFSDSFNMSSIDDDGSGDFGLHFTNSFDSANYAPVAMVDDVATTDTQVTVDITNGTRTSSSVDMETAYGNASTNRINSDAIVTGCIHGDLA